MKASSPGAPPDAVAVRRYPDLQVYSACSEYESRREHLRTTRERHQQEQFEERNRLREELGMPM
eukprot:2998088-Karenia_brevis.AAC.1